MAEFRKDGSEEVKYTFEDIPVYIRRGVLSRYPNYREMAHWHGEVELIAVLSGSMNYNINGTVVLLEEGSGIFVNSRQIHYGFSDNMSDCVFLCALIDPYTICPSARFTEKYVLPSVSSRACPYFLFSRNDSGAELFSSVCRLSELKAGSGDEIEATGVCLHILYNVYLKTGSRIAGGSGAVASSLLSLRNMLSYISENYGKKISLDDICRAGSVCKSGCNGIFRQYVHTTPVNYLLEYRLEKARELLLSTDLKITEICYETGFNSVSYFIELFKKVYGNSPARLRRGK